MNLVRQNFSYVYIRLYTFFFAWSSMIYIRLYTYIANQAVWKWLWNSQNFGCWVFSCSNHPQNGYPNFEAIWRRFTEIGHHEVPTYNGTNEIMIAERSDLSHLHYKLDPHDDRSRWSKNLRLIFCSKNIHHEMCFRMRPGSHLENPLYTELEAFFVFGVIFTILQTRHF